MLSNFYKKLLTVVMLICVSVSAFACGNTPTSGNSPETNSTSETASESISESTADKKIEAVIEDEPDGYVIPKIDHVTKKFTQPTLTDDEMYSVVFEKHSEIAKADSEGNYPTPNHELGEAYFAYTATNEFDTVYKCFGISTDIELSDEFSSYKIITNVILSTASSAAPINNAYWHKYFDVMLKNLEFNATDSNGDDYAVFAYIYEKNDDKENTYMVCSDGYVRTKNTDGIVAVSNKKVDAPEIYMVAELFEKNK